MKHKFLKVFSGDVQDFFVKVNLKSKIKYSGPQI